MIQDVDETLRRLLTAELANTPGCPVHDGDQITFDARITLPADPPALWQALGGRLRPALSLVATAPFDPFETKWTKAVRQALVGCSPGASSRAPGRPLHLSGVQVSTAGVVVDQESEQVLPSVAVTIDGREETTTTAVPFACSCLRER
jgi:hypothetical protein